MNISRSQRDQYKSETENSLTRVDVLITSVKRCAESAHEINGLVEKRTELQHELKSHLADLDISCRRDLEDRIRRVDEEVDELCRPLHGTEKDIRSFVSDLKDLLMACPVDNTLFAVRSEIEKLELLSALTKMAPVSFRNSYRDLLLLRQRLEELGSLLDSTRASRKLALDIPEGATWPDVNIRFLSDFLVQLTVREWSQPLNYAEAGFEDSKTRKPTVAWYVLCELARNAGQIQRPKSLSRKQVVRLEKAVQVLRKELRRLFGIRDDPFFPFDQEKCYRTKFKISFPNSDYL